MKVATFEGIVENGKVKLPDDVHVPERTKAMWLSRVPASRAQ